jgi:hypothetical protein
MKYCPNYRCVAYGRVVYSQSTRCVFCRWDLKPPRMKSETAGDQATGDVVETIEVPDDRRAESFHNSRTQGKRSAHVLRPTA